MNPSKILWTPMHCVYCAKWISGPWLGLHWRLYALLIEKIPLLFTENTHTRTQTLKLTKATSKDFMPLYLWWEFSKPYKCVYSHQVFGMYGSIWMESVRSISKFQRDFLNYWFINFHIFNLQSMLVSSLKNCKQVFF